MSRNNRTAGGREGEGQGPQPDTLSNAFYDLRQRIACLEAEVASMRGMLMRLMTSIETHSTINLNRPFVEGDRTRAGEAIDRPPDRMLGKDPTCLG